MHLTLTPPILYANSQNWYQQLVWIMVDSLGFMCCEVDQAVFFKHEPNGNLTIMVVGDGQSPRRETKTKWVCNKPSEMCMYMQANQIYNCSHVISAPNQETLWQQPHCTCWWLHDCGLNDGSCHRHEKEDEGACWDNGFGGLHWLLGIEVKREKESHTISLLQKILYWINHPSLWFWRL